MRRALSWLLVILVGSTAFGLTWWIGEAVCNLDRNTAVAIATVAVSLFAAPFASRASKETSQSKVVPVRNSRTKAVDPSARKANNSNALKTVKKPSRSSSYR
jgi:hypothetical protein